MRPLLIDDHRLLNSRPAGLVKSAAPLPEFSSIETVALHRNFAVSRRAAG
jgi:hypothetical protein